MSDIERRKKDHVDISVSENVAYEFAAGFADYRFVHNALPETDYHKVNTKADLLGRTFSFPLFISSMTGGYTDGGAVNAIIAEFCEAENLPFGVGSQRIMLEDPESRASFSVVREKAPSAFIASNIGGAQLIGGLDKREVELLVESIEADAIIVHLNPLQELMQPEGDRNFKGIEEGIAQLVSDSTVPVIVKETGAGISAEVSGRLLDTGVRVIDIAGAGGTSWAKVENLRSDNPQKIFDNWGIPTLYCLNQISKLKRKNEFEIIASGGVRNGLHIAKALCLGADFAASAHPVIKAVIENGYEGLESLLAKWCKQLKIALTLLGCETLDELHHEHLQLI